ncbi:hypothetical protein RDABS01_010437 [Bienertia sinuspersici]
MNKYFGS